MRPRNGWVLMMLIVAGLQLTACAQASVSATDKAQPVQLEAIDGTGINRVILTQRAAERLDIQTARLVEEQVNGAQRKVIPYAAVLYDLQGATWIYTSPAALTYVREEVTVEYIEGDKAVLVEGPAAGTEVVTVGVAELYGADTGIGK